MSVKRVSFNQKICWLMPIMVIFTILMVVFPVYAQNGMNLLIHNVVATPVEGKTAYTVKVYFSVIGTNGSPVMDLQSKDFSVTEDGQSLTVDSVNLAKDDPIYITLLMDTSGSMSGSPIVFAQNAASSFINALDINDKVAVLGFDKEMRQLMDFSDDRRTVAGRISMLNSTANSDTCLYDSLYKAIQKTASATPGRRALVLLTDGVDQKLEGGVCSLRTLEDVINLASDDTYHTPIYTIGLGKKIDERSLQRLSALSGGVYFFSDKPEKLEDQFKSLIEQIKSTYMLAYTSDKAPGAHTLTLQTTLSSVTAQDTRKFLLPSLPTTITINSPAEGEKVAGNVKVSVSVLTQGDPIARIVFAVDGTSIGEDFSMPYETVWDTSNLEVGKKYSLDVIAIGSNGQELTKKSVNVEITDKLPTPTSTPPLPGANLGSGGLSLMLIIMGVLLLVAIGVIVFLFIRMRKPKSKDAEKGPDSFKPLRQTGGNKSSSAAEKGADGPISGEEMGSLKVLFSKDSMMVGSVFKITKSRVTIGRDPGNDMVFPAVDSGVSRAHLIIEKQGQNLVLSEALNEEGSKPTYGTYINESKFEQETMILNSGDVIRMGSFVKIRFDKKVKGARLNRTIETLPTDTKKTGEVNREG